MLIKLMRHMRQFQTQSFESMQALFEHLSKGQHPEILLITCIDSRIMPSLLTQSKPGELLIHRNPGNIVPAYPNDSSEAASIEYALTALHIKDIIILGHSDCGAIKGLLSPNIKNDLPSVSCWVNHSHSVIQEMETAACHDKPSLRIHKAIEHNVLTQLDHLKTYPLVAEKLASNQLTLHGWVYHFETGEVSLYDQKQKQFITLEQALKLAIEERRNNRVTTIALSYLSQLPLPQTAEEYRTVKYLLLQIKKDLAPIWKQIKDEVAASLWSELGEFYESPIDPEFGIMLEEGAHIPLNQLKDLEQNIQHSEGYHQYCKQLIGPTLFKHPTSQAQQPKTHQLNCIF